MKRILFIEDEQHLSRFVEIELRHEGNEVVLAYDGATGLHLALAEEWDIILLDLMLPKIDGMEVCRQIRAVKTTPVIMLTARDSIKDRVAGLDCGADDYIPKPFSIEELKARMRVIFRREATKSTSSMLQVRDLSLNADLRVVRRGNEEIGLTKREFDLLAALMEHANRVMSREMLLDIVWGFETVVDTNVVDVYIRYLRNKIDKPGEDSYIQTLRGIGYMMKV
ncbi:response regulator transcription factor [Metasolibacillus meyeri]|uniref:Response regulator transcription factor n=1 Tax=Metasolibacillus meyeri TaxID=1071052 RepID=A0AAW9NR88_9BACL|nr:response regulator transcription factor [Metasolibacillus meyeri]MEC1178423.1 response regulator transcription factor [Metasolibacillus meyeri]